MLYRKYIKRWFDLFFAIMLLPFFCILFIVVAPLIYLEDRGPIFYNAPRLGRNGKTFMMYKFRSMKVNAPDLRNEDGTTFNSENDPRVTRIGRLLRKTSLDEIPQLLNVLRDEMSFIGPRPDLPGSEKTTYRPGDIKKLIVNPGITGYSQAYYRNASTLDQRFDGDLYYAKHVSLLLDLKILFKTVEIVLKHTNVYRN
ncbi:MAG: sugar transferase [Oscillospiraceae bacterium]|nr:sugar transferase [Oscillospiraceae bacterium]